MSNVMNCSYHISTSTHLPKIEMPYFARDRPKVDHFRHSGLDAMTLTVRRKDEAAVAGGSEEGVQEEGPSAQADVQPIILARNDYWPVAHLWSCGIPHVGQMSLDGLARFIHMTGFGCPKVQARELGLGACKCR